VPAWLIVLAWISLLVALVCSIWVIVDLRHHPQPMKIMNLVWPITMLWAGPIGISAYRHIGISAYRRIGVWAGRRRS